MTTLAKQKVFEMLEVNPLPHPICFSHPLRMAGWVGASFHASASVGHIPFGMYLIDLLRPNALAELGTGYGASYCGFCQAVQELRLGTSCYAIDRWEGLTPTDPNGPDVLADLEEHHNPLYGSFSRLIKGSFDDALDYFGDDTFDLLHMKGYHTYEAIKTDFEKWLPKMTDRGIILFHGISVRDRDSGVWKFWEELKLRYASFEFVHSQGLGVLAVGHDYPEELNALLHCSEAEAMSMRNLFSRLGSRLEIAQQLLSAKPELEASKSELQTVKAEAQTLNAQIEEASQRITALTEQLQERDLQSREQSGELIALREQMLELTTHQGELQRRTTDQDLLIHDKDVQLRLAVKQAEEYRDKFQAQEQEITELRQDLKASAIEAEEIRQELQHKEVRAEEVQHQRQVQEQQIEELRLEMERGLKDREIKAEEVQRQLQAKEQQIEELQLQLEMELKDREAKAEAVQQDLQAHIQQITELNKYLKDRDIKLQSAAVQIRSWERRTQELAHLLSGVEDIRHTGSYRLVRALSSPLRIEKKYRKRLVRYLHRVNGRLQITHRMGLKAQKVENFPEVAPSPITHLAELESGHASQPKPQPEEQLDAEWLLSRNLWLCNNVSTRETALFDAQWYLDDNPDVAASNLEPLVHYLRWGANEGRAPHPLFDPRFYLTTYPEAAIGGGANALHHYLTRGWKQGYKPNPKFDPSFYLQMYPDIVEAGIEPLTHFVTNGLREGRTACPDDLYLEPFDPDYEISREPAPAASTIKSDVKAIAFYLPQFHPIPENDKWWGTGFTEWTNVRRGGPLFKDHYQPHVPSVLDYYDLRDTSVLERQVALAQEYGIYGFCFYYYWFVGKILLDLPIRRMMERGQPDFPFCICWANENWTRRWDGQESEILIGQQHSPKDDLAFLKNIEPILLHKNYIRVDGKPLLIVYQPSLLPDARETAARWREAFQARGHGEIFLAAAQTFAYRKPPQEYGFDAVIQFPPHASSAPITGLAKELDKSFAGHIYDYNQTKWSFLDEFYQLSSSRRIFPGVMPSWDNTARRRNKSNIWLNSSPESYYDWLSQITSFLRRTKPHDEKLVFINAWNEWAEGCHLEPDQIYGHGWLNATRLALQSEAEAAD